MFKPNRRHCVVSLSKNINPSLVLVQPRKTHPFITERLLMGRKESNQIKKTSVSSEGSGESVQTHLSLCCSHTQSMGVDGLDQSYICSFAGYVSMCIY